eukprot:2030297-Rhodomonas_salina.1
MLLCACYAVSRTAVCCYACPTQPLVLSFLYGATHILQYVLCIATRCPVLTWATLLPGNEAREKRPEGKRKKEKRKTPGLTRKNNKKALLFAYVAICLRAPYAVSDSDVPYGATRTRGVGTGEVTLPRPSTTHQFRTRRRIRAKPVRKDAFSVSPDLDEIAPPQRSVCAVCGNEGWLYSEHRVRVVSVSVS